MVTRVRRDILGFKGDECDCGRRASVLHCNACGSTRIYARSNRQHEHLNGEIKFVENQFKCQTCGHVFIQAERQFCDAPPVSEVLAKLKVQRLAEAAKTGEYLRPKDAKVADALTEMLTQSTVASHVTASSNEIEAVKEEITSEMLPDNFTPPNGLTRSEYDVADRAFRLEWAHLKLAGQDTGISVEEYVERRLKGELFQ